MNEIVKSDKQELAWNGKKVRCTDEQIVVILTPMFALFPQTKADKATIAVYVMMLRDIAPDVLAGAVLKAMGVCKFLPTVAEIREQIETRMPGPQSETPQATRRAIPGRMHHLEPDEDRRQRLERLRQTKGWDRFYA